MTNLIDKIFVLVLMLFISLKVYCVYTLLEK